MDECPVCGKPVLPILGDHNGSVVIGSTVRAGTGVDVYGCTVYGHRTYVAREPAPKHGRAKPGGGVDAP